MTKNNRAVFLKFPSLHGYSKNIQEKFNFKLIIILLTALFYNFPLVKMLTAQG